MEEIGILITSGKNIRKSRHKQDQILELACSKLTLLSLTVLPLLVQGEKAEKHYLSHLRPASCPISSVRVLFSSCLRFR